ncbi:MAG: hypothetical protein M3437_02415 [Chloroflexota bacterium]|nr:hypothetical protein [Chloroflexota bacterium]MDQ5865816.1 hypothetical protein [Chloroflexota bacterium]
MGTDTDTDTDKVDPVDPRSAKRADSGMIGIALTIAAVGFTIKQYASDVLKLPEQSPLLWFSFSDIGNAVLFGGAYAALILIVVHMSESTTEWLHEWRTRRPKRFGLRHRQVIAVSVAESILFIIMALLLVTFVMYSGNLWLFVFLSLTLIVLTIV